MATVAELRSRYGTVWEILELRWDWAASRHRQITQSMYEAGLLQVLLAPDPDTLAARLEQQAALEAPVRDLNGVLGPSGRRSSDWFRRSRPAALTAPAGDN
jgi:hypothetical protein